MQRSALVDRKTGLPPLRFLLLQAAVAALLPGFFPAARAAPLGHKGSVIVAGEFDPRWSSLTVTQSLARATGVGPSLNWMVPQAGADGEGVDASSTQELWTLLMLTQRLRRWNGDRFQANLWAGAGAGLVTLSGEGASDGARGSRAAWSPWMQLDWETQRLYLAGSARWFQAEGIGRLMTSARAGVALAPADYNSWQPWLMVEARTMEGLEEGVEITPLIRVLHRRWLAEAGVTTGGDVRLNLSYTF